eukprot:scaffold218353_cov36-Prasinocladus_malaysianus.AAC.1
MFHVSYGVEDNPRPDQTCDYTTYTYGTRSTGQAVFDELSRGTTVPVSAPQDTHSAHTKRCVAASEGPRSCNGKLQGR